MLKERPADLARLAEDFAANSFVSQIGKKVGVFSPAVNAAFRQYGWPGNVRELRNVIERAVILAPGETIETARIFLEELGSQRVDPSVTVGGHVWTLSSSKQSIFGAFLTVCRSLDEAARVLGIDPATLYRKRQKLGLI